MLPCPFCTIIAEAKHREANDHAVALPDAYPVSHGHTLVVPRRHVESLSRLADSERGAVWALVEAARARLAAEERPDGFNIGINDGAAAGQTVPHAHVHVIPRYVGDVPDPRGGIRWVIPDKAPYW